MLSVADAQKHIAEHVQPLPPRAAPLAAALGLVLAEDVRADLDMPPYDKALMDGFALRGADLREGRGQFVVIEEILAGQVPRRTIGSGQAARIMTGAPMPDGADAVVMSERCESLAAERVAVHDAAFRPGQNILQRGREMQAGEVVLHAGARLRPQELGVLATVGRTSVDVRPRPTVAVLATGDELVEPGQRPGPGQIRNSNAVMLCAQAERGGAAAVPLGIAPDEAQELRRRIALGLEHDVLVLSGGVSAGKRDLVPGTLEGLGVGALFHKVAMKPGKPCLFGVRARQGAGPPHLVFGLPGNPVASLVCFELFIRPALRGLIGLEPRPWLVQAKLARDHPYRSDRPTYHPARLDLTDGGWSVDPVAWFGSPDLRGVAAANAFVVLPEGNQTHRAGQMLPVLCLEQLE